jgi:hypothetical protein
VAIGTFILDLKALVEAGVFEKHCEFKFPFETLKEVGKDIVEAVQSLT